MEGQVIQGIIVTAAVLFLIFMIFRWAWNAFLRQLIIILLPTTDHPRGIDLQELFFSADRILKKRGKRR